MNQEIQPPDYFKNILPNLTALIEPRREERTRNLRANDVFLQAKELLESGLALASTNEFNSSTLEYKATPPVGFIVGDQRASIWVKENITIFSNSESKFGDMSVIIHIGEAGGEDLLLFNIEKRHDIIYNPALRMGNSMYSIKNYKGREATIDEIEMLHETLNFIEQSLRSKSTLQSQQAGLGGGVWRS